MRFRLKISSRIIIICIGIPVVFMFFAMIYYSTFADIVPNIYQGRSGERRFYFEKLKSIQIDKGPWKIQVFPSDSNMIKIEGNLKILNYYILSTQTGTGISLGLSEKIEEIKFHEINAKLYTNSLKNVTLKSNANIRIDSAYYPELMVKLNDESRLQMKDCRVDEMFLSAHDLGTLETEQCTIGKVTSDMYDSSFAIIYSADSITPRVQRGFSVLLSYKENNQFEVNVSDSVQMLSNSMPVYLDRFKWLMPFDTALRLCNDYQYEVINGNYYEEGSYSKPKLGPERYWGGFLPSVENNFIISIGEMDFMGVAEFEASLTFARGLFNSVYLYTTITDDSLHQVIIDELNKKFGAYREEPVYEGSAEADYIWYDFEAGIGERFTRIKLNRSWENMIDIEISGPYLSYEDEVRKWSRMFRYYGWPEFTIDL